MLFESQSPRLAALIAAGRGVHDTAGFRALKEEAERWKPADYDEHQINLRHQYEGNIAPHLEAARKVRFENTGTRMPLVPLNWAALTANNGASVFDYPAAWYLERDGERVYAESPDQDTSPAQDTGDQQRAADFAEMVKEAHLELVMAEAERRGVLARTIFLRVHSDSLEAIASGKPPPTVVTPFWPNDVLVLPHPRSPASLSTAVALIARVSGDTGVKGGGVTWEVWTRAFTDDADGNVQSFGKWRCELVEERSGSEEVTIRVLRWKMPDGSVVDEWPLTMLPWIVWHNGIADGPFLDVDRNIVGLFDTMNLSHGAELFAVDMNAAAILFRKSDAISPQSIVLGPGAMPTIKSDETIESLAMGADFAGIRASNNALVSTFAMTVRQSASDFDATGSTAPSSGVALKIRNEPQAKARLEAIARAREMASRLLPVMAEVHDNWRATSILDEGITFCMEPKDPPEYEEKEATQRRALDANAAGLISDARTAVECGYYRTEEEATAAIEKIRAEKAARPSMMRQHLDMITAKPPADEPSDEAGPEVAQ